MLYAHEFTTLISIFTSETRTQNESASTLQQRKFYENPSATFESKWRLNDRINTPGENVTDRVSGIQVYQPWDRRAETYAGCVFFARSSPRIGNLSRGAMGKTLFGQNRFIFLNRLGLNLDHLQAGSRRVDPAFSQMGNNPTPKILIFVKFFKKNIVENGKSYFHEIFRICKGSGSLQYNFYSARVLYCTALLCIPLP